MVNIGETKDAIVFRNLAETLSSPLVVLKFKDTFSGDVNVINRLVGCLTKVR